MIGANEANQIMHIEGNAWSMSPGRADRIVWPYYEREVERGELTRDEALARRVRAMAPSPAAR